MNKTDLYGVILAGGSGSRLWPLSREMYPKQLLKLNSENTLFQSTFIRLMKLTSPSNILSITNVKQASDIKLQLNEIKGLTGEDNTPQVLIEPIERNTAPAICLSVLYILKELSKENHDPVILVSPSDHLIKDSDKFAEIIKKSIPLAESGYIVTFGIKPEKPDTGYGYISTINDQKVSNIQHQAVKVSEFKEKPDYKTAEFYCKQGTYYWNSGMFMFKASTMLEEFEKHANDIVKNLETVPFSHSGPTVKYDDYINLTDISIDYAVMEKSKNIILMPFECDWNDMGSWEALYETADRDENNNFLAGNVLDIDSHNSLIYSTSKLVSTIGLKDTVIIETEDAILACDKSRTQDVKKVFEKLKQNNDLVCKTHRTVYRPWGYYTVLQKNDAFQIKTIQVNPQAKLSLQMHYHRSEHWVVLSGIAKVTRDNEEIHLKPGDSIDIPATVKHSLENPGKTDLKIIEIQRGDYLEEDDIVRFEDIYGRVEQ